VESQYTIMEVRRGDHSYWRVTFNQSSSGLYPTEMAAKQAARSMFDLEKAIYDIQRGSHDR